MKTFTQVLSEHPVDLVAKNLVIIGALVWLFVGLFGKNFVELYLHAFAKYIYIIVGVAGVYTLYKEITWAVQVQTPVTVPASK
jgi:uncharacterized membrane protein YuzA (DUF378 family)